MPAGEIVRRVGEGVAWSNRVRCGPTGDAGGRIPPHNLEAEESLLGAMLISRDAITAAVEARVDASDFYKPAHGHIFDAVWSLYEQGEPVDPVTVAEELRRAEPARGARRQGHRCSRSRRRPRRRPTPAHYAEIVGDLALLRRLITVSGEIAESRVRRSPTTSPRRSTAPRRWSSRSPRSGSPSRWCRLFDSVTETVDQLETLYGDDGAITGVADRLPRPRQHPARAAAVEPHHRRRPTRARARPRSCSAPPRTSRWRAAGRCCSSRWRWARSSSPSACSRPRRASTPASCRPASSPTRDWSRLNPAISHLGEAPLFIDDNPHCTVMEMRAKARRIKARYGDLGLDRRRLPPADELAPAGREPPGRGVRALARPEDPRPRARLPGDGRARSSTASSSTARTSARCSPTSASPDRSSRTPTSCCSSTGTRSTTRSPTSGAWPRSSSAKHRNGPTGVARLAFLDHIVKFANMASTS